MGSLAHGLWRRRRWLWSVSAGAVVVLAAVACGSNQQSTPPGSDVRTPAASLTGAGSTFDAPFFTRAFAAYRQLNPKVSVNYTPSGSSAGIEAFQQGSVAFGATDVPMTEDEIAKARGGRVLQVPVALGAEAISYNLAGVQQGMHLTGPVLADIYLGRITRWRDPAITSLNPTLTLPDLPITVVHRSDGSGTTYIFTDYLSRASAAWAGGPGKNKTIAWPTGTGEMGNEGVANRIARTPGAVGYVELSYALQHDFTFAQVQNTDGFYVLPVPNTVTTAASQKSNTSATDFSIVDAPGNQSYPISGYSWVVIYEHQTNAATGQALVKLLDWLTQNDGQAQAQAIQYAPLPSNVSQLAHATLGKTADDSGTVLLQQKA